MKNYDIQKYPEASLHDIQTWTEAKAGDQLRNEDVLFADEQVLVLADGATDKTGFVYPSGQSGGRELAEIATNIASQSQNNGYELADEVTTVVQDFYRENNPQALTDPSKRASSTLAVVRISGENLVVTQIGDTNVRLTMNTGLERILSNDKLIDAENAQRRADNIKSQLTEFLARHGREPNPEEEVALVTRGREALLDRLKIQYTLQNNTEDMRYGYGTIDGTKIPREFTSGKPTHYVKTYVFPTRDVQTIELVSDGFYGAFPHRAEVDSYQELYHQIHEADPYKILRYLSTKTLDDASVVIARLS